MTAARPPANPVFVALDTPELAAATRMAALVADKAGGLKMGLEFFSAQGPKGVQEVSRASGLPIFLDLKFHDIPNTVAGAVGAACRLGVFMMNVHAAGGRAMMAAAAKAAGEAAQKVSVRRPLLLGVTVLTSMDDHDLAATGVSSGAADQVRRLAELAKLAGLDGVVCSAQEAAALRRDLGPDFKLVTPGVRPTWAAANDQKRMTTPEEAVRAGADYLVVGRPITSAADPAAAAARIAAELRPLLAERI